MKSGKGLLSLVIMIGIGTVSVITSSVAGRNIDLESTDDMAMEKLALIMAAAAEQEITAKAMVRKHHE